MTVFGEDYLNDIYRNDNITNNIIDKISNNYSNFISKINMKKHILNEKIFSSHIKN